MKAKNLYPANDTRPANQVVVALTPLIEALARQVAEQEHRKQPANDNDPRRC